MSTERKVAWLQAAIVGVATVLVVARILSVEGPLSGNDRSRWLTVRAIAEQGTWVVGMQVETRRYRERLGLITEEGWWSEDLVRNPGNGMMYSSKPPVYATLVAGGVGLLLRATGWTFARDERAIVRATLLTTNAVPFLLALAALAFCLRRLTPDPFAQVALTAAAATGTLFTSFQATLNNHTPAFVATALALYAMTRFVDDRDGARRAIWPLAAGLLAGTAAALEPPALALTAALGAVLALDRSAGSLRAALVFVLAALPPLGLFALTNYMSFGTPLPVTLQSEWFDYAGSYWQTQGAVAEREPSALRYAFHFFLGHHGVFLITPILGLGFVAAVLEFGRAAPAGSRRVRRHRALIVLALAVIASVTLDKLTPVGGAALLPAFAAAAYVLHLELRDRERAAFFDRLPAVTLAIAAALAAFYLSFTDNYGGNTVGIRWWIWTVPLWLGCAALATRSLQGPLARLVIAALVIVGVVFALEPGINPWHDPLFVRLLARG